MQPISDAFLQQLAGTAATMTSLFLLGVVFYVEDRPDPTRPWDDAVLGHLRAGTRIVLVLYAIPLLLPLSLVSAPIEGSVVLFVVLSALLLAANVDTVVRIRALTRVTGSVPLVLNEIVSTCVVLLLVAVPWLLGGTGPTREDLTAAVLLSLAAGFLSTCALVMSVLDRPRDEAGRRSHRPSSTDVLGGVGPRRPHASATRVPSDPPVVSPS